MNFFTGGGGSMSESKKKSKKPKRDNTPLDVGKAKIGFVGAGHLAEAIVEGLIQHGKVEEKRIFLSAPSDRNLKKFQEKGCTVSKRNADIFGKFNCDVIFIACPYTAVADLVKDPKRPQALCTNFISRRGRERFVLSLVPGIKLKLIEGVLLNPEHKDDYIIEFHRICMSPAVRYFNGCLCAIDVEPDSKSLSTAVRTLLDSISHLEFLEEEKQDALCPFLVAGLAFCFQYIKATADGALKIGLDSDKAVKFASKSLKCAAESLSDAGKSPNDMIERILAPGGPAIEGMNRLNKQNVSGTVVAAMEKAKGAINTKK
ncbi:pyrroline-5-carboxylate reductase 3-like [Brevipalpus obovatus]|uniref:pyrroline-5-carboxylate reductase 3-like n=1 Tax=Brevipalpus obovatus TaxID=246614 RepID=UPI003D9FB0F4